MSLLIWYDNVGLYISLLKADIFVSNFQPLSTGLDLNVEQ